MKMLAISRHMREALEDGEFRAFIIVGSKGAGKSTYAIKAVAHYLHYFEGLQFRDAYREALESVVFTAPEFIDVASEGRDVIIWDDAGVFLSTYMWFDEKYRRYLEAFLDYYDVVRTDASIIIFTTPKKDKLPPKVRTDPSSFIVRIAKAGFVVENNTKVKIARAEGVRNQEGLYEDRTIRQLVFRDKFRVKLPEDIYNDYMKKRRKYAEWARQRLARVMLDALDDMITMTSDNTL